MQIQRPSQSPAPTSRPSAGSPMRWRLYSAGILCAALGFAASAIAAEGSPQERYQQERADCMSGRTHQSKETCLKEAGAALGEARAGNLDKADAERLRRNAMARCQMLQGADRRECEVRMRAGSVQGDPADGGVIREHRTTTIEYSAPMQPRP